MKRKDGGKIKDGQLSFLEKEQTEQVAEPEEEKDDSGVFILENGRIEPISSDSYASSTMYRTVDSFSIDCRLVKPEEPGSMVYEGRKPSKKTIPILVGRDEKCEILDSWEVLESDPSRLANVREVLGVLPVKQVFVLKRK